MTSRRGVILSLVALAGTFAVLGCATSNEVVGPNGATAYDVACFSGRWACADEASRVCGGRPYVVLDENTALGMATQNNHGSLRIQCAEDYRGTDTKVTIAAGSAQPGAAAICRKIYLDVPRVAADWGVVRDATPKKLPPTNDDFLRVCTALPEAAQLCLHPKYHENHATACDRSLGALDEKMKGSLDALLLQDSKADASSR